MTLCETILATQDCFSKDIRDRIFALVGICSDGPDLVLTPNYQQSPEAIVRDVSRELLRRNMCFDIILVDERERCTETNLPTWTPDWLSSTLPKTAAKVAQTPTRLRRSLAIPFLPANANKLRFQGVVLGTITSITSIMGSSGPPSPAASTRSTCSNNSIDRNHSKYYGRNSRRITDAILISLLRDEENTFCAPDLHHFLQLVRPVGTESGNSHRCPTNHTDGSAAWAHRRWLQAHRKFIIHGRCLEHWLTENPIKYYIERLVEEVWGRLVLVLVILFVLILPVLLPVLYFHKTKWLAWISLGPFGLTFIVWLFWIGPTQRRLPRRQTKEAMDRISQSSRRLVVLHKGMIGMACSHAKVGDKICFLAGCTNAVVLRQKTQPGEIQHQVVGKAFVCLSPRDNKSYRAFVHRSFRFPGYHEADRVEEYNRLIEAYKRQDWWQEIVLV